MENMNSLEESGQLDSLSANWIPIGKKLISKRVMEKAKANLGETEDRLQETLQTVKGLLREHDLKFDENDEYLIRFIRFRKFNCPRILETIRLHMGMADVIVKRIGIPDTDEVLKIFRLCVIGILPFQDAEGRAIFYSTKASLLFRDMSVKAYMQACLVIAFYAMLQPETQLNGLTYIADSYGMSFQIIPSIVECARNLVMLLKCSPVGIKRIHMINLDLKSNLLVKLARPFMPSKFIQRIKFHGKDSDELLEYFEPSLLPQEFGGTLGPISNDHFLDEVEPTCKFIRNYIYKYSTLPLPP